MGIISSTWIIKDNESDELYCYWPQSYTDSKFKKSVLAHSEIDIEQSLKCRVTIKYTSSKFF